MLANCPPLGCSHFQTFGGTYSLITGSFACAARKRTRNRKHSFPVSVLCLTGAYRKEARKRTIPVGGNVLHDWRTRARRLFRFRRSAFWFRLDRLLRLHFLGWL